MAALLLPLHLLAAETAAEEGKKTILMMLAVGLVFVAVIAVGELTQEFAALAPPSPEQQELFAALRDDPEQISRFFGTIVGTVPIREFFGAPVPA